MDNPKSSSTNSLIWYFVLAFGFSWLFWLWPVLASRGVLSLPISNMGWVLIGAHGPLFASVVLTSRSGGWTAVRQLIRSGFDLRMKLGWWLAIILIPFALAGFAVWINVALNGYQLDTTLLSQPGMIVPMFLFMFFLGGSFQEEFGWRGYALPRLLLTLNPLTAALVLGIIWEYGTCPCSLFLEQVNRSCPSAYSCCLLSSSVLCSPGFSCARLAICLAHFFSTQR